MEFVITKSQAKKRLDIVLSEFLQEKNFTRAHIKNLIDKGDCLVDGKKVKAGFALKEGQKVICTLDQVLPLDASAEENIDFEIVFEDSDIIVVNKPQGLVVHPCSSTKSGTLVNGLLSKVQDLSGINGVLRPGIVHRLDKNT